MNLGEILADAARHHPDRAAIVWHDGQERRTYREVDDRASALAAGLVEELKVQPGDRVAVMMSNSPELLETLFAVWKAGAAISPLNARLTREEIQYQVTDCEAKVFIVGAEFTETVLGLRDQLDVEAFVLESPAAAPGQDHTGDGLIGLGDLRDRHAGELPPETPKPPTSLLVETGREWERAPLLAAILLELERGYNPWQLLHTNR